jgi:hypothetical protein
VVVEDLACEAWVQISSQETDRIVMEDAVNRLVKNTMAMLPIQDIAVSG